MRAWSLAWVALLPLACSDPQAPEVIEDAGEDPMIALDAGVSADASPADARVQTDARAPDALPDAAPLPDASAPDASAPDAFAPDAPSSDAGRADSGTVRPDAGAPPILNPGWIGGPCTADTDCAFTGGRCLLAADGWPDGTCTEDCTRLCPDQTGPLNSVTFCVDDDFANDGSGACLSRCDFTLSPTGCRAGYVCLPEKRQSQGTVVRSVCVPEIGVPGRPAPLFDIGAGCSTAANCMRNTCLADLPGGYCTQEACDIVGCPGGSTCFSFGLEGFSACLRDCAQTSECRSGQGYICDTDNTCWYVPPPPPACDLSGADADCATYSPMASSDFVVVTKHLRRMALCSGALLSGAYCVGLGASPVEDKEREGDRRTPEGVFYVPRKIPASQYYKAFLLSYPDAADAARGLAAGLIGQSEHDAIVAAQNAHTEPPQQTGLGGLIEIHGNGSGSDWTWGCIATEDSTIDLLWPAIDVGDTVVVLH